MFLFLKFKVVSNLFTIHEFIILILGDSFDLRKKQLFKEEKLKDLVEKYKFDDLFDYFNSLILIMDASVKKI